MTNQLFFGGMEIALVVGIFALFFAAAEAGFRIARFWTGRHGDVDKSQTSTLQAAVLGMVGLLAGFSLSMAVARFDARRQLIIDEANAIGTCYLRSTLLPQPHAERVASRLRDYLDLRIRFSELLSRGPELDNLIRDTRALQSQLWLDAVAANEAAPTVATGLFVQSLNAVIDIEGVNLRSIDNHVPSAVLVLLLLSAGTSCLLIGFANGQAGQRNRFVTTTMTALLAFVLLIIVDLDRPRIGLIRLDHQSLLDLRDGLGPRPTE